MPPTASIIIPTFNCAPWLGRAIESALAQSHPDFEVIVIDDGSSDDTRAVAQRYLGDPRVRYLHQENRGLPGARNRGAALSNAEFLAFLDADDELAPTALARMLEAMAAAPADWGLCDILKVTADAREHRKTRFPERPFPAILASDFVLSGMFYRRQAFVDIGGYDEEMRVREDWDMKIRMFERGVRWVHVPEPLYVYHHRDASLTKGDAATLYRFTEAILRKHHQRLARAGDREAARHLAFNLRLLARRYLERRLGYLPAARFLLESLRHPR